MAKVNVLYGAILSAICAFSGQANSIQNTINSGHISVKKATNSKSVYISSNDKLNIFAEVENGTKILNQLSSMIDEKLNEILVDPTSLSDQDYSSYLKGSNLFFALDDVFTDVINDESYDGIPDDVKKKVISYHRTYRETGSKFFRLINISKQIKEIPNYYESDINLEALSKIANMTASVII